MSTLLLILLILFLSFGLFLLRSVRHVRGIEAALVLKQRFQTTLTKFWNVGGALMLLRGSRKKLDMRKLS